MSKSIAFRGGCRHEICQLIPLRNACDKCIFLELVARLPKMNYQRLADLVEAVCIEVKRRNPLFSNIHQSRLRAAVGTLSQLSDMKRRSPGSDESGKL
jgi:hypothetical protein